MALSIFSSEKRIRLTFLAAILLIVPLLGINIAIYIDQLRGKDGTRAEKKFWRNKIIPLEKFDMVFLGDSRTLAAIDPACFDRVLGVKSYNGAFTGGSLNKTILDHAEKVLLKTSGSRRAVIFGVTPMTMSNQSRVNDYFTSLSNQYKQKTKNNDLDIMDILFSSIRTKELKDLFRKRNSDKVFHENGWLEKSSEVKPKARRSNLHGYRIYLNKIHFSEESMSEILHKVEQWKKQNITVFAFRPPTLPEMDKLENELGKCDFALFKKRLEASGGIWLDVAEREKYNSYDASHLERNDAMKLSADLADKINKYFTGRK